ncbi:porin [Caballeronia sordidicola]|uniref:Outer membrane protein (Porin) n=1 Tax=Caballeronia sordidicola TaxID=196367 RepID=A0A226WRP4_CABSO|nr:porin [Caballeronia sordidicola]OXC73467.1 Outer membrane protein (porin) [Caballeronia sordidicola]
MKYVKTLSAAGAVLLSSHSLAQSSSYASVLVASLPEFNGSIPNNGISLYGSLDEGMNYQSVGGKHLFQLESGGEWTSKFGMFGREDLGGGLKAEFNLESGFNASNGNLQASQTMFNREAWVGLNSTVFGQVRFGNQIGVGTPLFFDPFGEVGSNSVVTWLGYAGVQTKSGIGYNTDLGPGGSQVAPRVANSVTWNTPRYAGFNAEFLYAFNGTTGVSPLAANQGVLVSWARGPLYVAATYNRVWSSPVVVNAGQSAQTIRNDLYSIGGVYDCGSFVLDAYVGQYSPHFAADGIARVYTVGGILPLVQNVFRASVVYRDTSGVRDSEKIPAKDSAVGVMLGYDYILSKRTALYARAGFIRNYGISTVLLNNNPLPTQPGTTVPLTGQTPVTASIGIYHNF